VKIAVAGSQALCRDEMEDFARARMQSEKRMFRLESGAVEVTAAGTAVARMPSPQF
jgi:hypothetical protein